MNKPRWPGRVQLPTLTAGGRAVASGSIVLYVAGWALGYVELLVIATAGVLALGAALVVTAVRPGAQLERTVAPERVMRGDSSDAHLSVTSPDHRWLPSRLVVRDRVGDTTIDTQLARPAPGTTKRLTYRLPTERRGLVPVGPLGTLRADPLGLLQAESRYGQETELRVYPKVHELVPLSSGRKRDLEGPTHDGASGSITFHALREYVTGDDLRLIHWRSTARTGTLMVRQQADPSQPRTTVILDTDRRSYADADAFETAVDVAASVLVASTRRRFPVRLVTGTGPAVSGPPSRATATTLLDHLTTLQWSSEGALDGVAATMGQDPGGTSLVVVTGSSAGGSTTAAASSLVEMLRQRYMTLAVVRVTPGAEPGAAWDRGVLDLVAPTAETFAALWNQAS